MQEGIPQDEDGGRLASHPSKDGPQASLRAALGVALACVAVVLFALEGLARLALPPPPDSPLLAVTGGEASVGLYQSDPVLWWRNRPGAVREMNGRSFHINELGLRGASVTRAKPEGSFRVLSLGESSAFGFKVDDHDTYAHRLEACLRERVPQRSIEVLNAAVPAWSVVQSAEYLKREGMALDPDLVLVYHGRSDFMKSRSFSQILDQGSEAVRLATDREMMEQTTAWQTRWLGGLYARSRLLRWTHHILRASPENEDRLDEASTTLARPDARRVPEAERRLTLAEMLQTTRAAGVDMVVLVPAYRRVDAHRAVLLELRGRAGVEVIDLEPVAGAIDLPRAELFFDCCHAKPVLHEAIAQHLCDELMARAEPSL